MYICLYLYTCVCVCMLACFRCIHVCSSVLLFPLSAFATLMGSGTHHTDHFHYGNAAPLSSVYYVTASGIGQSKVKFNNVAFNSINFHFAKGGLSDGIAGRFACL